MPYAPYAMPYFLRKTPHNTIPQIDTEIAKNSHFLTKKCNRLGLLGSLQEKFFETV